MTQYRATHITNAGRREDEGIAWADTQARMPRDGRPALFGIVHLAEEIEVIGRCLR